MNEEADDSPWAPDDGRAAQERFQPRGVDDAWAAPIEHLPPPPVARPASADDVDTVLPSIATGPVEAVRRNRPRALGRGLAAAAAVALLGGGGYLAITAGSADAGADSPEAALEGAFDALADEDLLGAAEFVEPTERDLLIEAGFDIAAELVRLEVLAADLDLAAVDGIDIEVTDLQLSTATIAPGVAHVYIDGGRWVGSLDVADLPLGPLVLDRAPAEWSTHTDTVVESIEAVDQPVVAVERGGRWYLSLWYSVAENVRLAADLPYPDPTTRPVALGAASPEEAVRGMVDAAVGLDLEAALVLIDPEEAAALYDYADLFLAEGQQAADELEAELRADGWQWQVTDLGLRADVSGPLAEVAVESFAFEASQGSHLISVKVQGRELRLVARDGYSSVEIVSDGDCVSSNTHYRNGQDPQEERFCLDDLGDGLGVAEGLFANLQSVPTAGVVAREVDGRWFVSPTRTGTNAMLDVLAAIEPDALAAAVDAVIGLAEEPLFFPLGPDIIEAPAVVPTTTFGIPARSDDNADLIVGDRPHFGGYDLSGREIFDELRFWSPEAEDIGFRTGFTTSVAARELSSSEQNEIVVFVAETVAPGTALGGIEEFVAGELVTDGAVPRVVGLSEWGSPMVAARIPTGIVVVGSYEGWTDELLDVLVEQTTGR